MMKKSVTSILAIAAACALAAPAAAGERAGALSISPFAGGYTFDGVQHLQTAPVYGLRLGYDLTRNWGVEAVGSYLSAEQTLGEKSYNAVSYGLDLLYNFMPDGPFVPYLAAGGGGTTIGHGSSFSNSSPNELGYTGGRNTAATANAGLGFKYFVTDSVALRGDARQLFVFGDDTLYNWQYTAGLSFLFGGKSAPAPAARAQEPPAKAVPVVLPTSRLSVSQPSITKGQSARLAWSSENATDCQIQPEIGAVPPQGSHAISPAADTSYKLTCNGPGGTATSTAAVSVSAPVQAVAPPTPTASLSVTPVSVTQGQPAKLTWTSTNASNCVIEPKIGQVQPQGSTEIIPAADTNYSLACTGAGGTANSSATVRVTTPPPAPKPAPKPEQLCVTMNIEFATGKSVIPPRYEGELARIAAFMKEYPQVNGVIEGHTDNQGGKAYNLKLSEQRAQSVKNYIVKKFGIDASRLGVKGYGFSKPVADNATAEGRQKNRRIIADFGCVEKK